MNTYESPLRATRQAPKRLVPRVNPWLLSLVLFAILGTASGCSGVPVVADPPAKSLTLPAPIREAQVIGPAPINAALTMPDGEVRDVYIVPESDFDELTRELLELRAWQRTVRLLHGLVSPPVHAPMRSGPVKRPEVH